MADRKTRYDRRQEARGKRHEESQRARRRNLTRTLLTVLGGIVVVSMVVGGFFLLASTQKLLPPTEFGPGHIESFPPQQINTQPILRSIQEHVMERGGGHHQIGSMLVQYKEAIAVAQ